MKRDFWINQGLFQISWPACVIGAAYGRLWPGVLVVGLMLVWQLQQTRRHRLDLPMLMICLSLGIALDTVWVQTGLLAYASPWPWSGVAPLWIVLLWVALALVINHSMAVFKSHLIWLALFSGIGSPMSYFAGARFGAVEWLAPAWQVVLAVGLSWAVLMPALFWLARDPGRWAGQVAIGKTIGKPIGQTRG